MPRQQFSKSAWERVRHNIAKTVEKLDPTYVSGRPGSYYGDGAMSSTIMRDGCGCFIAHAREVERDLDQDLGYRGYDAEKMILRAKEKHGWTGNYCGIHGWPEVWKERYLGAKTLVEQYCVMTSFITEVILDPEVIGQ